jgi:hypothetical protein
MESKYILNDVVEDIISLHDAKEFLRVSDSAEDGIISIMISSAIGYAESRLGYPITKRESTISISDYDGSAISLNPFCYPATITINAISGEYSFEQNGDKLVVDAPVGSHFAVDFSLIPHLPKRKQVIQACLLLIGKFYEQRGDESKSASEGGWETINRILDPISRYWL